MDKKIEKLRIVIYDADSGQKLQDNTTDKALILFDMTPEDNEMTAFQASVGDPPYVVGLLNSAINRLSMLHKLEAMVVPGQSVPFFQFADSGKQAS